MVEQSLKYFEDRISSSLKPNGQDLRTVFSSERTKNLFLDFLTSSECRCLFTSCHLDGSLSVFTNPAGFCGGKCVTFFKCKHVSKLRLETMVDDVLYLEHSEQLLNDLWLLSREVYLPLICVSGAEEHHVLDRLLDSMHCLIAATEVLGNHAKKKVVLPLPSLEVLSDVSSYPNRHAGVMHVLETSVVMWLKQIKLALLCDPSSFISKDPFPGPLVEREFWATRLKALNSVREQLSSLLALTILTNLEEAHSSYAGVFGQVYKDVDMAITDCQHILIFLNTLHPWIVNLKNSDTVAAILRNIPPFLHTFYLIVSNSRYYGNTVANLERLLNLMSNDVMTASMKFLSNDFLLDPEKYLDGISCALRVCASFRGAFLDYKDKFDALLRNDHEEVIQGKSDSPSGHAVVMSETSWPVWTSPVFSAINAFMERLNDLHEVVSTYLHFRELRPLNAEEHQYTSIHPNQPVIFDEFQKALEHLLKSQTDILQLNQSGAFEANFFEFRCEVKVLERQVSYLLCDLWDRSSTPLSQFRILELYRGLSSREEVQARLSGRCSTLLLELTSNVLQAEKVLQSFITNPSLKKCMPPTASALLWLQGFQKRLEGTAKQCEHFSSTLLGTEDGWTLRNLLNNLMEQVLRLQKSTFCDWKQGLSSSIVQCLEEPVLMRLPGNDLAVNINPEFLLALKEVKFIGQTSFAGDIPDSLLSAKTECERVDLYCKLSRLTVMVQEHNAIRRPLTETEAALFQHRIVRMETLLEDGITRIHWLSKDLEDFISVTTVLICGDFSPRVRKLRSLQHQIHSTIAAWGTLSDTDAFDSATGTSVLSLEELSHQQQFACEKLEIILTSGVNKIDQLVHECFSLVEAGGDSPVWSSCLHQINAFVLRGLKDAFMSAIGSLLRRVELYEQGHTIQPLMSVKVELLGGEVAFVPALDSQMSDKSIPEIMRRWLSTLLETCGNVRLGRGAQQGKEKGYLNSLQVDPDIISAMNKVVAHLESSARHCQSLKNKFLSFSFVWEQDVEESFDLFLKGKYANRGHRLTGPQTVRASAWSSHGRSASARPATATTVLSGTMGISDWTFIFPESDDLACHDKELNLPTLDDFDLQIAVFEGFAEKLSKIDDFLLVGWLRIDSRPIKHALQSYVSKWKYRFTSYLADRICNVLQSLDVFLAEVEPSVDSVTGSEDDWEQIRQIISVFNKVSTKAQEMDGRFGAVHRSVQLLEKYGHPISKDVSTFLAVAPQKWMSLKKKIGIAKQRVSPKVQANGELVYQELDTFRKNFDALLSAFQDSDCLRFSTGHEDAAKTLNVFKEKLMRMKEAGKDLEVIQELFEKSIFSFSRLEDLDGELTSLEKLTELSRHFTAQHLDWKAHRWCHTDTMLLANATALQTDQLRNLPQYCSQWDLYKKLCSAVAELQCTLPVINDLLRPSLRPRHWKQVVRLAVPRRSANTKSLTPEEIKTLTLGRFMEFQLHTHAADVRLIADRADKDLAVEMAIKTFEEVWLSRIFCVCPQQQNFMMGNKLLEYSVLEAAPSGRDSATLSRLPSTTPGLSSHTDLTSDLINIVDDVDAIVDTVSEHQTSLQALLGTSSASSFMEDLNKWRNILQTIEAVLKLWMSVQDLWCLLREVYVSNGIKETLPGPALAFSVVDQEYCSLVKQVKKNSNVMYQCCQEGQLSKLEKMYHSLKDCKMQLLEYTRLHQESCPWLMLLPSDDVLQFICHGSDPIFLSASINKILPPAEGLLLSECAQEVKVSGIISKDGDTLTLLENLPHTKPIEVLLSDIMVRCSAAIKQSMRDWLQHLSCASFDIHKLKSIVTWLLEDGKANQVALTVFWAVLSSTLRVEDASNQLQSLSDLLEYAVSLHSQQPLHVTGEHSPTSTKPATQPPPEWLPWQLTRLKCAILIIMYYRSLLLGLLSSPEGQPKDDCSAPFLWSSSLKFSLGSDGLTPTLSCGGIHLPYGFQYTGAGGNIMLTPETERCLFSLLTAVNTGSIAFCTGREDSVKQGTLACLSESTGHTQYYLVCSRQSRMQDLQDVIKAAVLTGIWICMQGFDSLPEGIAYSTMSHLCMIMDAMRQKLSTICFEEESISVAGTQFYCLLVDAPRDSPECFFSRAPLHLATQYRCIGFTPPDLKILIPVFLIGSGFSHTQKLTSDVYSVVSALPPLKNHPLTVTTGMLNGVINLAAKHKEVLVTSGSLTTLYTDTADYLHVGSETYLQRNVDDLGTIEVSTSEVASERQSASRFKEQSEVYVEPLSDQLHATMDIVLEETAKFAEGEKEAKTVPTAPDGTSQLVEQFALMLALKDVFLPAYGGVATEKGKLFTSLLGSVFAGLSIDKVINEEIEALQKAGSFTSHREMLDSVRESRAVSVLGKSVSPPLKAPLTLEEAISSACRILELEPTIQFQSKIIQFIQLLQANDLILLNGAAGCGKTSCFTVASEAMRLLGYSVQTTKICLNRGIDDIGGHWEDRHWIDGILPYTLTELLSKQTGSKELTEGASPVAHWLIIDDSCCLPELLRMIHSPGMLSIPSRKTIMLPPELKIIVESALLIDVAVPLLQLCPGDIGWGAVLTAHLAKSELPVVKSNAPMIEGCFRKFMAKVFNSHLYNQDDCPHYLTVTACHLFEAAISEAKAQSEIAFEAIALFATTLSVKGHLKAKFDGIESGLRTVVNAAVELPTSVSICDCYLDVDHCRFVPWQNTAQGQTHQQLVPNGPLFISTAQTVACSHILSLALDHGIPVLLRGNPGSGKTSCVLNHVSKYTNSPVSDVKTLVINVTEITTASNVADRLIEQMSWTAGNTYVPLGAKKLVCILDGIHKAANSSCGKGVLKILQQHIRESGFQHPDSHQWYRMADVSFIVVADNKTELQPRFSQPFLLLDWQDYSLSDLHFILCELLRDVAVQSETTMTTNEIISKIVDVSLDLHKQLQQSFYCEALCYSLFSLADLTRIFHRVSSLAAQLDTVEDFLLAWQHESFWAYSSKLPSDADVARYLDTAAMAVKKHFSNVPLVECLYMCKHHVVLPADSGSLASPLVPLATTELLRVRKYIQEHMDEVQKVEPVAPLIFCSQMLEEICHLTEVLAGPFQHAHCLLIGHSGAESVLAVVAHIICFKVVRLTDLNTARYSPACPPDANGYSLEHFRRDIVSICSRAGAKDEKLLVHICEEDIPDPFTFMVYLEELINNCSITHLFTEEEKSHVINAIRSSVTHAGIDFCQDSAWVFFLRNLRKNVRVVVTVSASPPKLFQWLAKERPSLLRLMNVIHHRPWSQENLLEVAELQIADLGLSSSERKRLSHVLTSMHVAVTDQQIGKSCINNWTYKNFVESYVHDLCMLQKRNAKQCQELSESLDFIAAAECKSDSLIKCLEQELTLLEEKKYACVKILDQLGQDTAIAAEHHKLQLRLKERLSHLERMLPEYEHAYEIAVARTAQLVSDTKDLVAGMNQESLSELRLQHSPVKEVESLLSAVIIIVKSPHADLTWTKGAKRLMANLGRFAEMLSSFDEQEVLSSVLLDNLSLYLEDNAMDLNYHKSMGHPDAVLQICHWVNNVVSYHQMLENKVKPLQTKLQSMKQLHADLKHKLLALTDKIHSLTKRLDDMHQSLEDLSVDKSLHDEHVQTVKGQLVDISNFVQLLQGIKVHWIKELENKRDAVINHYGSLAFVVGYAVYLAKLPRHVRKDCLQKWWPACLSRCGVELHLPQVTVGDTEFPITDAGNVHDIHVLEQSDDSQSLHETSHDGLNITMHEMALNLALHLADASDILHLLEQGFSNEDALNFLIMKAPWKQSVVLIDPEQQSFKLLEELHSGKLQFVDGRFVDGSFFSTLETAITVGQPLVVHRVCQDVDPAILTIMQQAKIASANQGLYMNLHGKRLLVHPHFFLYLVTPLPLEMLQSKIVSTAVIIDFTPYTSQLLSKLRGSTNGCGQLKALLDDYHRRSAAMIKTLSQFEETSFAVDVIQDEMQALLQVRSQILASDMSKALRLPAHDLLSEPASQLYGLVNVLSRCSGLVGLPLQEWVSLVHGLDSDVPEKQQLEALFMKALSVASRFLAAPLWKCLLAACRLLPVSAPDQGSANDSTVPVPDVPCSDLSTSLQDIILNFLEAPHLRPLLLVHNDKSFVSMLNKSCVVDEFKHACKATGKHCEVFNLSVESIPTVLRKLGALPPSCCILVDAGCAEGTALPVLTKQLSALSDGGCACALLCNQQNLTWHVTCECEAVLLSNLKVASSTTRNPGEQESLAFRRPRYLLAVLLAYSLAQIKEEPLQPQCKAVVFRLCALHAHLLHVAGSSSSGHTLLPTALFLSCLGQVLASSTYGSTSAPELDFKVPDYIQEVYSSFEVLLDGTSIGEYLLSQEIKVGDEAIPVPSDVVSWLSDQPTDHDTLWSMLSPDGSDLDSVQLTEMVDSVLPTILS